MVKNEHSDAEVQRVLASGSKNFRGLKLSAACFDKMDLQKADFRGASLPGASFVGADLSFANFDNANCTAADFTDAKCFRTNFRDANLCNALMFPSDLFGATFTLECKSFQGMKVLPGWWYGWLFYGLLMEPPSEDAKEKLIALLGVERYALLRRNYTHRGM